MGKKTPEKRTPDLWGLIILFSAKGLFHLFPSVEDTSTSACINLKPQAVSIKDELPEFFEIYLEFFVRPMMWKLQSSLKFVDVAVQRFDHMPLSYTMSFVGRRYGQWCE